MSKIMENAYQTHVPGASHWSLIIRRGMQLKLSDPAGKANVGMLFYNPENLLERYNAPDTLKCQHTFKLTKGHCLYSDMGRIFCSIIEDDHGWHDTVCANTSAKITESKWGARDYQNARNEWNQNGHDSFIVELAKYGLGARDMAANLNLFSKVITDDAGNISLAQEAGTPNQTLTLRFEMDTLVLLHTCPHPLNQEATYPRYGINLDLRPAEPIQADDACLTHCDENRRGFENNRLYYLGR